MTENCSTLVKLDLLKNVATPEGCANRNHVIWFSGGPCWADDASKASKALWLLPPAVPTTRLQVCFTLCSNWLPQIA